MKQTGTFYTLTNNESSAQIKKPLPNIFLYFSQNNVRKLTTQTNASGKFDFDLPLGNYNVTMSMGANSTVHTLAGGSEFSLTSSSKVNAFEQWAMTPVYLKPEENPLVIRLAELAKIATDAATEAKAIQDAMNKGSSGTGKWVKESLIANMMNVGDFGIGVASIGLPVYDFLGVNKTTSFHDASKDSEGVPFPSFGIVLSISRTTNGWGQEWFYSDSSNIVFFRHTGSSRKGPWSELYHSTNTTIDSNGNIKAASPIIKLFNYHIESNDSFKEKPVFEKLGIGVYKISNTLGLAKEGWYIETPKDKNGLPYFLVDWEQDEESQDVIIRVFKKKLDLETLDFVNGDPVDIGQDQRWIDLRFHEEPQQEAELFAEMEVEYK